MKTKRPNGFLYFVVYILFYPLLKILFRLKVDRSGYTRSKEPFIVVSNHSSFMDFLLVMLAVYPRRLNAVAAQKFFLYKPLNRLLPIMGSIPKNLFDPDIRSIMRIMSVIKQGGSILLYPEGRCSTDGLYAGIHKSTGKLIKKLGIPVISCHIEGGYVCMPFWRKGIRLGRERMTIANLFSAEDTKSLSVDDINSSVDRRLSGLDTPPPEKPFRTNRARRLAEGLENILYWCPGCGHEFTLETKGNIIRCTECGFAAEMDREAKLTVLESGSIPESRMPRSSGSKGTQSKGTVHLLDFGQNRADEPSPCSASPCSASPCFPGSVHDWFREIAVYEYRQLSEDMHPITEYVTVRMPSNEPGGGMRPCGEGMLRLDPDGWHFDGELDGKPVNHFYPIGTVPALPFDPKDNFQIYSGGSFYMFTPEDACKCVKYSLLGECAYWRFASDNQMTQHICGEAADKHNL